MSKEKETGGKMKLESQLMIGLLVLQVILLLVVANQLGGVKDALAGGVAVGTGGDDVPTAAAPSAPSAPAAAPVVEVSADDDSVKGDKDAPVTIVEFSDFECPFCARFYTDTLPSIQKEYIDTGKVKIVYRDFPLSFHPNAQKAAEAAECAGEQGKFWEMHDVLFENYQSLNAANYKKWAQELGLDTAKFNDCLDSGKMASEVSKDQQDGASYGVRGTPAFFVNGRLISGAQPFANFKAVIDAELAE